MSLRQPKQTHGAIDWNVLNLSWELHKFSRWLAYTLNLELVFLPFVLSRPFAQAKSRTETNIKSQTGKSQRYQDSLDVKK